MHHDTALFQPEENVSVVAVTVNCLISSDGRGVFKVIDKFVLAFHTFHFFLTSLSFPETSTRNRGSAVLGVLGFYPVSRI